MVGDDGDDDDEMKPQFFFPFPSLLKSQEILIHLKAIDHILFESKVLITLNGIARQGFFKGTGSLLRDDHQQQHKHYDYSLLLLFPMR